MNSFKIKGPFIKLNQLLKLMGWCSTGSEANSVIEQGLVFVNGNVETRKRNKIQPSFEVVYLDNAVLIESITNPIQTEGLLIDEKNSLG